MGQPRRCVHCVIGVTVASRHLAHSRQQMHPCPPLTYESITRVQAPDTPNAMPTRKHSADLLSLQHNHTLRQQWSCCMSPHGYTRRLIGMPAPAPAPDPCCAASHDPVPCVIRHTSYTSTFATSSGWQNPWATYVVCRTSACVQEWQAAWQVPNSAHDLSILCVTYMTGKQQIGSARQEEGQAPHLRSFPRLRSRLRLRSRRDDDLCRSSCLDLHSSIDLLNDCPSCRRCAKALFGEHSNAAATGKSMYLGLEGR